MTPQEKQYISFCLKNIRKILDNQEALQEAINSYTEGNSKNPRYLSDKRIADTDSWPSEDQLKISAAVFVANAEASTHFCKTPDDTHWILRANQTLLNQYIPLITQNATSENRFLTVKRNIDNELAALTENNNSIGENPYTLFAVAAGVVAVGVALLAKPGNSP